MLCGSTQPTDEICAYIMELLRKGFPYTPKTQPLPRWGLLARYGSIIAAAVGDLQEALVKDSVNPHATHWPVADKMSPSKVLNFAEVDSLGSIRVFGRGMLRSETARLKGSA